MKNRFLCFSIISVVVLVVAQPTFGQVSDTDVIQQMRADAEADRQAIVTANMELTNAEGQRFWPLYRKYRNDTAKVGDRLQKLIQDYAEIYDSVTESQAKRMTDEMLDIQKDALKVRRSYVSKFRKVLPEVKVTRFLQIENKLDAASNIELVADIPLVTASD